MSSECSYGGIDVPRTRDCPSEGISDDKSHHSHQIHCRIQFVAQLGHPLPSSDLRLRTICLAEKTLSWHFEIWSFAMIRELVSDSVLDSVGFSDLCPVTVETRNQHQWWNRTFVLRSFKSFESAFSGTHVMRDLMGFFFVRSRVIALLIVSLGSMFWGGKSSYSNFLWVLTYNHRLTYFIKYNWQNFLFLMWYSEPSMFTDIINRS